MKRDMDLIRELLLKLENINVRPGAEDNIPYEMLEVDGFTHEDIAHHLLMLVSARFIDVASEDPVSGWILKFRQITWQGHDFLDSVRDPKIWSKTKKGAEAAGGFTVDLLKDLAKGFVKTLIEEKTGVKL